MNDSGLRRPPRGPVDPQGRGYIPLAGVYGCVLLVALDAPLAWRLKEAFSAEPFAPLDVAAGVEQLLHEYVTGPELT